MVVEPRAESEPRPSVPLTIACLASTYVIWGTTYYAIKVGIEAWPTFFLVGTRFVVAGLALLGWQALRRRGMPTARQWRNSTLLGVLLLVMGNGAAAVAEHWVSSGATVALVSIMPLIVAVWSGVFGEWPRPLEWCALALGAAGTLVMLLGRDLRVSAIGTLVILVGTTSWSLGTVLSRRLDVPRGASGFGAEMLTAGLVALILSLLLRERWSLPVSAGAWWSWAYLVVFGSLIAFSAYRYLVERVSATLAATYAYVNPPVGLLVGFWLGSESFSGRLLLGLPIVLAAVALLAWAQAHARSPAAITAERLRRSRSTPSAPHPPSVEASRADPLP
jgi:drug/metabolite transporter (DMT)-like permease